MTEAIDQIMDDFAFLDDWEDRYRYVIELGRSLDPLPEAERTDANKVRGCASQVWLSVDSHGGRKDPVLTFRGDSDALIVRGLIAVLFAIYNGRRASEIASADVESVFSKIGLRDHLTAQRANGLTSMVERIRQTASLAAAA